jgi:hypothetical protein
MTTTKAWAARTTWWTLPVLAAGAIYTTKDGVRPGLATGDPAERIIWAEGGPAFVLASAGAVRINFRAIYAYPPDAILRPLDRGLGWHGVKCNTSAWALCSSDVGQALPLSAPRMPERSEAVTSDGWNRLACTQSAGKVLVSLGVYDISACDILDEGLDLVYAQGMLYHRRGSLDTWRYWGMVVLAVILVRCLSFNIRDLWDPETDQPTKRQRTALLASFTAVILACYDGDPLIVTSADQIFFWATAAYILVYLAIHAYMRWGVELPRRYPVYNVMVATLQLIACKFYGSAETPYNLVLITILATRAW